MSAFLARAGDGGLGANGAALVWRVARALVPALTTVLFTLVVMLPWGLDGLLVSLPPLLVLTMIFAWVVRRPRLMPVVLVFALGAVVDVVTASPLGFWAFLFLVGQAGGLQVARLQPGWPSLAALFSFLVVSPGVIGLAWLIQSAYFARAADAAPLLESLKLAWFALPAIVLLVALVDRRFVHRRGRALGHMSRRDGASSSLSSDVARSGGTGSQALAAKVIP
ncbi:MAG: hypothetical protein AAFQ42_07080 [Pseudomonadota bacterium]